jgi:hypothetical protein
MLDSSAKFISKEFDEFNDKTVIKHRAKIAWRLGTVSTTGMENIFDLALSQLRRYNFEFQLRRVKTKESDLLVLDCNLTTLDDWYHARNGDLIFNCDQENYKFEFSETQTNVDHVGDKLFCFETGYYLLSQDDIKRICDSEIFKIRLKGDSEYIEPDLGWCAQFKNYCQQFYNNSYDALAYQSAIAETPTKRGSATKSVARWPWVIGGLVVLFLIYIALSSKDDATASVDTSSSSHSSQSPALVNSQSTENGSDTPSSPVSSNASQVSRGEQRQLLQAISDLRATRLGNVMDFARANNWTAVDQEVTAMTAEAQSAPVGDKNAAHIAYEEAMTDLKADNAGDHLSDAIGAFTRAINADPADLRMRYEFGALLIMAKHNGEAVRQLSYALVREPDDAAVWADTARATANDRATSISALRVAIWFSKNRDRATQGLLNEPKEIGNPFHSSEYEAVCASVLADISSIPIRPSSTKEASDIN